MKEKRTVDHESMVSLIYKNTVITVAMDSIDGTFIPSIRLAGEDKDRSIDHAGFPSIDKAVAFARKQIDILV